MLIIDTMIIHKHKQNGTCMLMEPPFNFYNGHGSITIIVIERYLIRRLINIVNSTGTKQSTL